MKFTYTWLKEHLDTKAGVEKIADTLTRIGLEVEKVFDPKTSLAPFRVAEVVKCEKHPNADKLSICEVDTGSEHLQVLCGAPNARAGMKGVFAPVGSYVPGIDLTLTKAKIRGVESNGMLLSERELEISDEHIGIIELAADAKVGSTASAALGLDDAVTTFVARAEAVGDRRRSQIYLRAANLLAFVQSTIVAALLSLGLGRVGPRAAPGAARHPALDIRSGPSPARGGRGTD